MSRRPSDFARPRRAVLLSIAPVCALALGALGAEPLPGRDDEPAERLRVLLLGNSYTYYHQLDRKLDHLLDAAGFDGEVARVAEGGFRLQDHLEQVSLEKHPGSFDAVVLQGQSRMPLRQPAALRRHAGELVGEIRARGAEPVFFQTWPRRHRPADGPVIAEVYRGLAESHDSRWAPVGRA
ncbi:MAG: hypothetical protein MI919_08815, partial [Holophagales bacterium]|nr:hypothetical protein [Holophagales bacterium]